MNPNVNRQTGKQQVADTGQGVQTQPKTQVGGMNGRVMGPLDPNEQIAGASNAAQQSLGLMGIPGLGSPSNNDIQGRVSAEETSPNPDIKIVAGNHLIHLAATLNDVVAPSPEKTAEKAAFTASFNNQFKADNEREPIASQQSVEVLQQTTDPMEQAIQETGDDNRDVPSSGRQTSSERTIQTGGTEQKSPTEERLSAEQKLALMDPDADPEMVLELIESFVMSAIQEKFSEAQAEARDENELTKEALRDDAVADRMMNNEKTNELIDMAKNELLDSKKQLREQKGDNRMQRIKQIREKLNAAIDEFMHKSSIKPQDLPASSANDLTGNSSGTSSGY